MAGARGALVFLLLGLWACFYPGVGHNEAAHLDLARAIVEDGTLAVDRYRYNSADLVVHEGRTYSNKAPGAALLALPAFVAARALTGPLPIQEHRRWDLVAHLSTLGSVGLISALAAGATGSLLARSLGWPAAAAGVLGVWLATPLLPFSTMLFGHAAAAGLVGLAAARLLDRDAPIGTLRDAVAGSALGLAVTTEFPAALLACPLLVLGLASRRSRIALLAGFASGLLPLLVYQRLAFGNALVPGYLAYLAEGASANFPAHARGLLGVGWRGQAAFLEVLAELTIRPARGLFRLCPLLVLVLPGLVLLARSGRLREAATIASAALLLLGMNAAYGDSAVYWGGGTSLGPRHLVAALPLLALPLAHAARRWPRTTLLLGLPSLFTMLIGTAVEPRVPYEQAHALRDFLLPRYWRGEFGLQQAVLFTPDAPGQARNLGAWLGLPGPWQLLPVAAVSWWLGRRLRDRAALPRLLAAALGGFALVVALAPTLALALKPPAALQAVYVPDVPGARPRLRRDAAIHFEWIRDAPVLGPFRAAWRGALRVERAGEYRIRLEGPGAHALLLDGRELAAATAPRGVQVSLSAGDHALELLSRPGLHAPFLRLYWQPPGAAEAIVPASSFAPRN